MPDTQTHLVLFNAIATAGKTLYEIAQGTSKLETKQQLMEVYDTLMNLKKEAADLEDINRDLKERLRFKSEDFEFKNPFWFEKRFPDRALCPKCFSKQIIAPVGVPYSTDSGVWRQCLACDSSIEESRRRRNVNPGPFGGHDNSDSWMG